MRIRLRSRKRKADARPKPCIRSTGLATARILPSLKRPSANCAACDAFVTYSGRTALTGDAPLNDLWQTVTISFIIPASGANTGPRTDFSFLQDTDNDVRVNVPEPETYAMMLAGLGLLGFIARRRMRNDNTA